LFDRAGLARIATQLTGGALIVIGGLIVSFWQLPPQT
jgi:hypothetical protein